MSYSEPTLFYKSVRGILQGWSTLQIAIEHSFGGSNTTEKAQWLLEELEKLFITNCKKILLTFKIITTTAHNLFAILIMFEKYGKNSNNLGSTPLTNFRVACQLDDQTLPIEVSTKHFFV